MVGGGRVRMPPHTSTRNQTSPPHLRPSTLRYGPSGAAEYTTQTPKPDSMVCDEARGTAGGVVSSVS
eukprot:2896102-Pyramimonas_sp.AAC.1